MHCFGLWYGLADFTERHLPVCFEIEFEALHCSACLLLWPYFCLEQEENCISSSTSESEAAKEIVTTKLSGGWCSFGFCLRNHLTSGIIIVSMLLKWKQPVLLMPWEICEMLLNSMKFKSIFSFFLESPWILWNAWQSYSWLFSRLFLLLPNRFGLPTRRISDRNIQWLIKCYLKA